MRCESVKITLYFGNVMRRSGVCVCAHRERVWPCAVWLCSTFVLQPKERVFHSRSCHVYTCKYLLAHMHAVCVRLCYSISLDFFVQNCFPPFMDSLNWLVLMLVRLNVSVPSKHCSRCASVPVERESYALHLLLLWYVAVAGFITRRHGVFGISFEYLVAI